MSQRRELPEVREAVTADEDGSTTFALQLEGSQETGRWIGEMNAYTPDMKKC